MPGACITGEGFASPKEVLLMVLSLAFPLLSAEVNREGSKMPKGHQCPAGPHVLINNHSTLQLD